MAARYSSDLLMVAACLLWSVWLVLNEPHNPMGPIGLVLTCCCAALLVILLLDEVKGGRDA